MNKDRFMKDFNGEKIFSLEYDKETLKDMVIEKQEEIERLNNIINELEKWLKGEIDYNDNWYNPETKEYIGQKHFPDDTVEGFQYALDKLDELKGSDKDNV